MKHDSTAYAAERPKWDTKDCSVRALAVATGLTYDQSSMLFKAAGRRLKDGTSVQITRELQEGKLAMTPFPLAEEEQELRFFLLFNPTGRFVLHRKGHAFAVVDGVVHDWEGTRAGTKILRAWRVTEETLRKVEKVKELLS